MRILPILACVTLCLQISPLSGVRFISNTSFVSTAGEDAYLGCVVEDPLEDLSQISWQRSADLNFVVYRPDRGPIPVNELGKRVRFERKGQWDGSIILQNVSPSDEGTYICIFTIFPSGPFHRLVRLMVNVKPEITVFTEDPIEEGETESRIATCRAENGKPAAKISWRTPFPTLGSMESSSMHEDLTITIESQLRAIPARSMHRQEVQCVVEHLSLPQPEVVSSKLTVQYPPSVVVIKIDTPTKLAFQCEADAYPPVDRYDWKRENEVLPDGAAVTEAQLEFSVITPDLSGLYYCRASTPNATATGVLYLQIGISTNYMALFTLAVILLLSVIIILVFFHAKVRELSVTNS
ncbi:nectin-1-like isoform X2 [Lepisosteus oculatus]|uniref:nectin-1-like isoform X2 n=1 Tax=Lepisosteus oculatus TaxID=7918 RepID=UPI0035F526AC